MEVTAPLLSVRVHRVPSELRRITSAKVVLSRLSPAVERRTRRIRSTASAASSTVRPRLVAQSARADSVSADGRVPEAAPPAANERVARATRPVGPTTAVARLRGLPLEVEVAADGDDGSQAESTRANPAREIEVFVCSYPSCIFRSRVWPALLAHKAKCHFNSSDEDAMRNRKDPFEKALGQRSEGVSRASTLQRLSQFAGISVCSNQENTSTEQELEMRSKKRRSENQDIVNDLRRDQSLVDLANTVVDDNDSMVALQCTETKVSCEHNCFSEGDAVSDCSSLQDSAGQDEERCGGELEGSGAGEPATAIDCAEAEESDGECSTGYRCMLCVQRCSDAADLARHEREAHFAWAYHRFTQRLCDKGRLIATSENAWVCFSCNQEFGDVFDGATHVFSQHGSDKNLEAIKIRCHFANEKTGDACNFEEICPQRLVVHYKMTHVPNQLKVPWRTRKTRPGYKCQLCEYSTGSWRTLRVHFWEVHGKLVTETSSMSRECFQNELEVCPHCGKLYLDQRSLRIHVTSRHPEKVDRTFACRHCEYQAPDRDALIKHICPSKPKGEVCDMCGGTFFSLARHKVSHHQNVKCHKCGGEFDGAFKLRVHLSQFHRDMCSDCGLPFSFKEQYGKFVGHECPGKLGPGPPMPDVAAQGLKVKCFSEILRVMPDKTVLCLECGYRIKSSDKATLHDAVVHRPIPCQMCNLSFLGRKKFVQHMVAYHPSICTFCGGSLSEENHSCAQVLCKDDSFFQHIPVRSRPKYCNVCGALCSCRSSLRNHLKSAHGVEVKVKKGKPAGVKQKTIRIKRGEERRQECKM